MTVKRAGTSFLSSLNFSSYLVIIIILIIVPLLVLTSLTDYEMIRGELTESNRFLQHQTEKSIVESMVLMDTGLKMFDNTLNLQMREGFDLFIMEYERAGRDPSRMDLYRVKEQIGGTMDLYIINESGVIEYTTYKPDLGYDFKNIPYFFEYITRVRQGDSFSADRVVNELATGQLRKFAYMPTPDHRYLLELGLNASVFKKYRQELKYRTTAEELRVINPNVEYIRIFNWRGDQVTRIDLPDDALRKPVVKQSYMGKTNYEMSNRTAGQKIRYLFINLTDPDYASDMSLVVELTYNTHLMDSRLGSMLVSHVLIALSMIFFACGITVVAARHITRPIQEIVEDVDIIARGDLNHTIRVIRGREFASLERSINTMVGTLKANILRIRQSEDRMREHNERLEEQVDTRAKELRKSNEMVNLYLDILSHDIKIATDTADLYVEQLLSSVAGESELYTKNIRKGLRKSTQIIKNVDTIRRAREEQLVLRPISLDHVIRAEIANFPGIDIRYSGTTAHVLADDLLEELFTNLLGNSARILGTSGQIWITVDDAAPGYVEVSVEDNGPGMPDTFKQEIFSGSGGRRAGRGLGLYICRMLVERYGGSIGAEDRISGEPDKGVAIKFKLRRAQNNPPEHS